MPVPHYNTPPASVNTITCAQPDTCQKCWRREKHEHIVRLDGDFPQSFSGTCEAYAFRSPCWAVAAALLEHVHLAKNVSTWREQWKRRVG